METPAKRSHFYLNNDRNTNPIFKIFGGAPAKKPIEPDEEFGDFDGEEILELNTAEISAQQQRLGSDVLRLKQEQTERYERRSTQLVRPVVHLDYLIVHFQQTVFKKLQVVFEKRPGA